MKSPQEWFNQADYDFQTAEFMFGGGRYIYTVFMSHLAVEKALKGLKLHPSERLGKFLINLDQASVVTRYPEELSRLQTIYTQKMTQDILDSTKEVLTWVKQMS